MTVPPQSARASGLVERDGELAAFDELVAAALAGEAVLGFVEGPAGIGKSRLLGAAGEQARRAGLRVLTARGSDLERDLPFGVVRQLFEPALAAAGDASERWLTGAAAPAARVFTPPTLAPDDDAGVAAGGDVSFAILGGLFWLTATIAAERPLLLAVDDLQWCDPASLRFVAYLQRRLEGLRVLVVTASRPGAPDAQTRLIGEIAHDPAARSLRPRPLTDAGTARLIAQRLHADPDPAFAAACRSATGGNPLLLAELLSTLEADGVTPAADRVGVIGAIGPRAVERTVSLRMARLSPDAGAVARAVAVLGDRAALAATSALAGLDDDRVAAAVRALVRAEILRPDPPLGFVHPLVRDAVHDQLAPADRELDHERAARVLADLGAPDEDVAAQLLAAPCRADAWTVAALRDAARAAQRRGVPESAAAYLDRALREPPPADERAALLLELGSLETLLNRPSAVEHLGAAHASLEDPLEHARAGHALARMLLFTRPPEQALAVIADTLAGPPAPSDDERRALEALELWAGVAFGADVPDAATRLRPVRAQAPPDGTGARMLLAVAAWDRALRGGSAQECARLASAALADGTLIAADPGFMAAVATLVLVLAELDEAVDAWDRALREAHRSGSAFAVCAVDQFRGWTWLQRGELAEAESALRAARENTMLVERQRTAGMAYVTGFLARVRIESGDVAGARTLLAGVDRATPGSDGDALVRQSEIELLLAEARWSDALAETEPYRLALRGADNPAWGPWRSLRALALDGLGRTDEAVALLEDELVMARGWGAPGALSRTLRLLGTMRRGAGLAQLEEAVAAAARSSARLEEAKALSALGSALRRERRPADAREPLRRAIDLAGRCGARPVAEHARAELLAAGGRPRAEALAGPGALTPSERRVADLAAGGLGNREIAQTLYVTPKTVEVHLTSTYRKLGIATRRALPQALEEPAARP